MQKYHVSLWVSEVQSRRVSECLLLYLRVSIQLHYPQISDGVDPGMQAVLANSLPLHLSVPAALPVPAPIRGKITYLELNVLIIYVAMLHKGTHIERKEIIWFKISSNSHQTKASGRNLISKKWPWKHNDKKIYISEDKSQTAIIWRKRKFCKTISGYKRLTIFFSQIFTESRIYIKQKMTKSACEEGQHLHDTWSLNLAVTSGTCLAIYKTLYDG